MRLRWWPGYHSDDIRPAMQLVTRRGTLTLRFGRDGMALLSERISGTNGRPKTHWYGPFGLTLIVRKVRDSR